MRQRVVVIGHSFTSRLGVIRAVAESGAYVIVIVMTDKSKASGQLNTKKPIDGYSKFVDEIYYCYKKDEDGLIRLLLEKCAVKEQRTVLFPDSDFAASAIDRHMNRLDAGFLFPHIHHKPGEVNRWMDKSLQKELARKVGLIVADSCVIEVNGGVYELPSDLRYPCFPKPAVTLKGDKYMRRCDSEPELRAVIEHLGEKEDNKVLVEDFKLIEEEYAVLGFSDGEHVIIPGVIHFLRASKSHFGLAMQGRVSSAVGFSVLIDKFKAFVREIGFVGVFDIDFFRSDGVYYFDELNLRYGGSGYAITKAGVNLPAMMVRYFSGESREKTTMAFSRNTNSIFVNERMCLDDWYQGYLSTKEYFQLIDSAEISFVRDTSDPGPQQALDTLFAKRRFRRLIRSVVKSL